MFAPCRESRGEEGREVHDPRRGTETRCHLHPRSSRRSRRRDADFVAPEPTGAEQVRAAAAVTVRTRLALGGASGAHVGARIGTALVRGHVARPHEASAAGPSTLRLARAVPVGVVAGLTGRYARRARIDGGTSAGVGRTVALGLGRPRAQVRAHVDRVAAEVPARPVLALEARPQSRAAPAWGGCARGTRSVRWWRRVDRHDVASAAGVGERQRAVSAVAMVRRVGAGIVAGLVQSTARNEHR